MSRVQHLVFVNDGRQPQSPVLEFKIIPFPDNFRPPEFMSDHIGLIKAYILCGNSTIVDESEFSNIFDSCFPADPLVITMSEEEPFDAVAEGVVYRNITTKILNFKTYVSIQPALMDACYDGIRQMRADFQMFIDLLRAFLNIKFGDVEPSDEECMEQLKKCNFENLSFYDRGTIEIDGFATFTPPDANKKCIEYLQVFCLEIIKYEYTCY